MRMKTGAAILASAAVVAGSVGVGEAMAASKAVQPRHTSATFTMYADVDAEGDLGSHYAATKVTFNRLENFYQVSFTQKIGSCAAYAQGGKAGGSDPVNAYTSIVTNVGDYRTTKTIEVRFIDERNGGAQLAEPFMLTVVCRYTS